ncbi:CvpA family protein [Oliverpabstia intestinalis]|uniref:CvpA family protein n=1 Tax=Oliverpabstia intestinalis TaxID=2606633 RepID=UPI003F88FDDA
MKKGKIKALLVLLVIVLAGIYYYATIPAINIHSTGIWIFILLVLVLILAAYAAKKKFTSIREVKSSKFLKIGGIVMMAVLLVFAAGSILSSPIVNAKQYRNLLTIEERDFSEDIQPVNFSQIPLLDKDSAMILGNRKMGSMVDMVSQFEVSDLYSQINYQEKPVRVTPLVYASPIKWLTNQSQGIPAYIMIDMTTQDTSLVKLDKPIRYSEAEYLNRNIYRHLRFHYPTYIFDQLSFEIDDNGTPYWVCPVRKYTIGLFGGATIGRVVLCNAQTGECQDYTLKDCPEWVDRANPADLLIQQYNYYGTLVNGYINSIFGQKGCLKSTDGYNYMAMEDDVWVYTGVTSVSGDQSNVGFVLINQRTRETRYYKVNGAEEYSAMGSAEGQVQNLGYKATFPILLNISNEPTYFMALKDGAGLVKKYAMVNIQKYQNVAIGDTVSACQDAYVKLLNTSGITAGNESDFKTVTGTIQRIAQSVIDGNSHFYLVLNGHSEIFDVPVQDYLQVVTLQEGDTVTVEYLEGTPVCTVLNLE